MAELNINGTRLEINLLDADVMEKYEDLIQEVREKVGDETAYEGKSRSEGLRYQCRMVDAFFDGLFGQGTSEELFHGDNDLDKRLNAFAIVTTKADEATQSQINSITEKYGAGRLVKRQANQKQKNNKGNGKRRNHA